MVFAVFLSVLINSGHFTLDHLFVISHHVFLFHFLPLFILNEGSFFWSLVFQEKSQTDVFGANHAHFNQLALPEKYQMLCSSELLYLNLPTSLYTHPSFRFTLTVLNRGINVEFIPTWCRGANPIATTKSRGVRAGATRRNRTSPNSWHPGCRQQALQLER